MTSPARTWPETHEQTHIGISVSYILEKAERFEELAAQYPQEFEHWQTLANEWRIELPPQEIAPGPVFDADFIEMDV